MGKGGCVAAWQFSPCLYYITHFIACQTNWHATRTPNLKCKRTHESIWMRVCSTLQCNYNYNFYFGARQAQKMLGGYRLTQLISGDEVMTFPILTWCMKKGKFKHSSTVAYWLALLHPGKKEGSRSEIDWGPFCLMFSLCLSEYFGLLPWS